MKRNVVIACCLILATLVSACQSASDDEPTSEAMLPPTELAATATPAAAPSEAPTETAGSTPSSGAAQQSVTTTSAGTPTESVPSPTAPPVPEGTTTVSIDDQALTIPAGYTISIYAEDLGAARFMALDDDGSLYVTDRLGRVLRLPDGDGDGIADATETVLDGLNSPHGITFHAGAMYVAEETRVIRATDGDDDGVFETTTTIIDGLPEGGHWSRTIRFGPDGMLYLSVGSSCNVCEEEDPRRAAIWRYNADGSGGEPFAIGMRNAVGITFHPETGQLWVTNNGRDGMGDDVPPETINQPNDGDDFGWPRCHAGEVIDPQFGSEDACEGVAQPAVLMQSHSAPLGLTFASGEQLAAYDGDLFVAFHGSWNRSEPTGYKVVGVPFENGAPSGEVNDLVSGWLLPDGDRWGRPVDVIVAADGALMISDDEAGRIFRLSVAT
ncbi:MAG TPA: PQQ-dependent sugar dehydrogenase [Thermomicrobiales bacterium]|nr:PQQ-dependent sugar dehydrogenase [Thermomicrobiales bacterium]